MAGGRGWSRWSFEGLSSRFVPTSLRHRLFRRFWFGLVSSVFGYRMFQFSQFWLAHELTGSPLWLGLVGISDAVPAIALNLFGGAVADRVNRRRLIMGAQGLAILLIGGLGLLVVTGHVEPWHLLVVAGGVAGANAFDQPARMALYPDYVPREALMSAVALNSAAWQMTRIVGPAAAGIVIALAGTAATLFLSAVFTVGMVLVLATLPADRASAKGRRTIGDIVDGIRYLRRNPLYLLLLGLIFFNSFFILSYIPLMPVFAVDILGVGASGQGVLIGVSGVGSLLATLWISSRESNRGSGTLLVVGGVLAGVALAAFSLSTVLVGSYPLGLALVFGIGAFTSMQVISVTTALQTMVSDEYRGRVMGMWGMNWNMSPLGAMYVGAMATVVPVPWAVAFGGMAVIVVTLAAFLLRPELRTLDTMVAKASQPTVEGT